MKSLLKFLADHEHEFVLLGFVIVLGWIIYYLAFLYR